MAEHWKANKSGGLPPSYYNNSGYNGYNGYNNYNGMNKYPRGNRYSEHRGRYKLVLQSVISVIIFGMVWGVFQWQSPAVTPLQGAIRAWFTVGSDLTPVFNLIDGITAYGDSFDKAGYELVSAEPKQYEAEEAMTVPVSGTVICPFGSIAEGSGEQGSQGIVIETEAPSLVKAAYEGTITGISKEEDGFKVIISHNKGLVTSYGQCSEVYVKNDQLVKKGQTIGRIGDDDSQKGQLYFEAQHLGQVINPLNLLKNGI